MCVKKKNLRPHFGLHVQLKAFVDRLAAVPARLFPALRQRHLQGRLGKKKFKGKKNSREKENSSSSLPSPPAAASARTPGEKRIRVCVRVYAYMRVHTYIRMHMYTRVYAYVCIHTYVCIRVHTYVCIHTHTHLGDPQQRVIVGHRHAQRLLGVFIHHAVAVKK